MSADWPECRHCDTRIYNDSDSHPTDPHGPWAAYLDTSYECDRSPTGLHRPGQDQ